MNEKRDSMTDPIKRLEDISRNWFQIIEESTNDLNQKFDILCENITQNESLLEEIEDKQQNKLKAIISKSNININGKTYEELSETDLKNQFNCLESSIESLSCQLMTKKEHKTELTNKTKALTKQLEEMEIKVKELRQNNSNETNDSNEYLTLASVMRVMYKTWNNSKVIGLLFNDNEEKSLERLIVIDRENKSEQQMAQQFWDSLEKDYQMTQ